MQLKRRKSSRLRGALSLLTLNVLAAATAHAQAPQTVPVTHPSSDPAEGDFETGTDLNSGLTRVDSSVLFYQEAHGRVKATEPVVSATLNSTDGQTLNAKITYDSLTGATPNGAAPWRSTQTFIAPTNAPGSTTTRTSASGRSTIVTIPGTGTVARQYTADPDTLPVDSGFRDQRYAIDLGYSRPLGDKMRVGIGGGYSHETDYQSFLGNIGLSRDFNQHATTLAASLNYEYDQSKPLFGTPSPLTVMSASPKGPGETKTVFGLVLGVTQVMNRYWLAQLNYSVGETNGYQTDPYKILSVVNASTGAPLQYLYEGRPNSRLRQSVYLGNKVALGPTFLDLSLRGYHDDWGINSFTVEASDRLQLGQRFFIEPGIRYYEQSAADFFHDYLIGGQPLPQFASSDSRLDAFNAVTGSLKLGYKLSPTTEIYLQLQDYKQSSGSHASNAPGYLASRDLFSGVDATSAMFGISFAFW